MSKLFSELTLRKLTIRNRIFIAPMCQYSCEQKDGVVSDWHLVHLGARAAGGAGLIIAEATAVAPEGRISPWCPGIWNQQQVEAWARVNKFIHEQGAKSALQLAHAGRKGSSYREWSGSGSVPQADGGWQTVAPSAIPFDGYETPRELSLNEIEEVVQAFAAGAKNAIAAGFDAVEIHAAHGYLLHQFLSPLTNQRTDDFGGSLENRARLLLGVVKAVRSAIGEDAPILVRFSATDYKDGGWNEAETSRVATWCSELGADLFDISTGGLITGVQIPTGPGYQVPMAEYVADRVSSPVGAVGQITTGAQAEEILSGGKVEVVLIGRASLRDPSWPLRAAHELGVELDYWPKQYRRGGF